MKLATHDEIYAIVGSKYLQSWIDIKPEIFYKDMLPFGLIGYTVEHDIATIASTTVSPERPFTMSMSKRLRLINREHNILLITDVVEYHNTVRTALEPHGFTFSYEEDIMFSYRDKQTIQRITDG